MELLLLLILAVLIWIAWQINNYLREVGELDWFRDTTHPVYSKGELKDMWNQMKDAGNESSKHYQQHRDEISRIADKLKGTKNYKLSVKEEEMVKKMNELSRKHLQTNDTYDEMIKTNIGVVNGNIKKPIREVEDLFTNASWVSDEDIEKDYKEWVTRVSK